MFLNLDTNRKFIYSQNKVAKLHTITFHYGSWGGLSRKQAFFQLFRQVSYRKIQLLLKRRRRIAWTSDNSILLTLTLCLLLSTVEILHAKVFGLVQLSPHHPKRAHFAFLMSQVVHKKKLANIPCNTVDRFQCPSHLKAP